MQFYLMGSSAWSPGILMDLRIAGGGVKMAQRYLEVDCRFSKHVRALRLRHGWKQQTLAVEASVSLTTIKRIENIRDNETQRFLPLTINGVANALKIDLEQSLKRSSTTFSKSSHLSETHQDPPITLVQMLRAFLVVQHDAEKAKREIMAQLQRVGIW